MAGRGRRARTSPAPCRERDSITPSNRVARRAPPRNLRAKRRRPPGRRVPLSAHPTHTRRTPAARLPRACPMKRARPQRTEPTRARRTKRARPPRTRPARARRTKRTRGPRARGRPGPATHVRRRGPLASDPSDLVTPGFSPPTPTRSGLAPRSASEPRCRVLRAPVRRRKTVAHRLGSHTLPIFLFMLPPAALRATPAGACVRGPVAPGAVKATARAPVAGGRRGGPAVGDESGQRRCAGDAGTSTLVRFAFRRRKPALSFTLRSVRSRERGGRSPRAANAPGARPPWPSTTTSMRIAYPRPRADRRPDGARHQKRA